jgi:threonylcarbamoyladenosine tRNA methylthiotransferase MtaB
MNRPYSIAEYERAVSLTREAIPDLAITTDIIVGFPGESEKEFEESYGFCQRMGFANIHVFPYSARVGTVAATMPHQVGEKVKKERSQRMLTLTRQSQQHFRERFLGQYTTVLWESRLDETTWSGLTPNYLRVHTRSDRDLTNRLLKVRLLADSAPGLWGKICDGG